MAGGGVAFSQALQGQNDMGTNPSEPVVKYGTGGRIAGFASGGRIDSQGVKHFEMGGLEDSWGVQQDGGFGGGDDYDFGGGLGGGDGGWSDTAYPGGIPGYDDYVIGSNNANLTDNDDVPEVIITTDRPAGTGNGIDSLDIFNPNDILFTDFTGDEDISEIVITTDRPTDMPIDTFTFDSSDILITDWVTETDTEDVSEIIITTDRPTQTPIDTFTFTDLDTDSWVTETDTEDVSEIIVTTDRPPRTPPPTDTVSITDTDSVTWVTETDTEEPTETIIWTDPPPPTEPPTEPPPTEPPPTEPPTDTPTIWWTDPPTLPPRTLPPRPTVPPVTDTPRPTDTVMPRTGRYRPQYQNYADPLTMFNVSNYGRDLPTSAAYNYAASHQGIDALNQNLRDMADRQMAQTYPGGAIKGADMNQVLAEMRKYGLTAADLENARYGRTTGLNTPFSQYNKEPPTARTFGGGIAELIKMLPK